jgi:hypothetical protein
MTTRQPPVLATLALVLPLAAAGCVESSVQEKTAAQLDGAIRAGQLKDQQLRALEWQLVTLAQQLRDTQLRSEAAQRDLYGQIRELTAANAALAERLKREDAPRPPLPFPAEEAPSLSLSGSGSGLKRADDLRRLVAALDARHAEILERIAHLEKQIEQRAVEERAAARAQPAPARRVDTDVIDPWGFGSRK